MKLLAHAHLVALLLPIVTCVTAKADLVTIDFDSFTPTTSFSSGVEDGFQVTSLSGPVAVSNQYLGAFSGINSIHHQAPGVAVFEITHALGEMFELESFRAGSTFGSVVPFTVIGFSNGSVVGFNSFTPTLDTYTQLTANNLSGVQVDRIVFNLGNAQIGPTHIDDVVVNTITVPEPIGPYLGVIGIALLLRRRRIG